ncbi:hypothetical protein [Pseudomonas saudiphocaensis]|uniref:Uncharacterized protein n=1 Tax=Pseudomonas saudiphocaensis TaxID=1499686 RepID=A0A078LQX2_9PSED|nr:hypothetical protein [Pseudomonas saudiphocaensis]RRV17579.1 hypothetical protein EGJ00_03005 [Pseudomonas saudiphocaensis]CDZ94873.1 hypothetical protein BN1079_02200 [Pseudomonas saudiphocaensis]
MFSLKRQGDFRLQLTRTLTTPGRHPVELYLFTPHETTFSTRTLTEEQFFHSALVHRFRLLGLPTQDRASKRDTSFSLLSPHYEILHGAWFFQYQASLERLRQQYQSKPSAEPLARALRLSQNFAQRLRKAEPKGSNQSRYFRQLDIYFSWLAEQFLLESMVLEGYDDLDDELKLAVQEFLQQERRYRADRDYLGDFKGPPTRVWNRMSLYQRLLEYPVVLRQKIIELGAGTRKLVKAGSTMLIMSLFTYFLFNVRDASQKLSLALLVGIALIYAVRDLLRDDLIDTVTRWLRKGKPRWRLRLLMPYTHKLMAQQLVWLDYRKLSELSKAVREHSGKWATNEERQIVCYRSKLVLDKAALSQDEIQERLILDFEPLCALIQASHQQLFEWKEEEGQPPFVQAHAIEKQHDYNLLVVCRQPGEEAPIAQRWTLRLSTSGIVRCENKPVVWPESPPQRRWWWRA